MVKSLVTGGAGFVGSNLVRRLLQEGHEVTVLDNLSTGHRANLGEVNREIQLIEGDLRNEELLNRILPGMTYVFHQAALGSVPRSIDDPWTSHDNNINGTMKLLLASRQANVQRVIYAASSSAYGDTAVLPKVETMSANPLSPYAVTKYVGELYCHVFNRVFGLETVALRYFNVFGPRQNPDSQYAAVIPKFITALMRGEAPVVHGDGTQTRDFTFVENVLEANVLAAKAPAANVSGQVFNIACGGRISLNDLVENLQEILGTNVVPVCTAPRAGDVRDSLADLTKARKAFGYQPKVTLRQGLQITVDWYRAQLTRMTVG